MKTQWKDFKKTQKPKNRRKQKWAIYNEKKEKLYLYISE